VFVSRRMSEGRRLIGEPEVARGELCEGFGSEAGELHPLPCEGPPDQAQQVHVPEHVRAVVPALLRTRWIIGQKGRERAKDGRVCITLPGCVCVCARARAPCGGRGFSPAKHEH
jgi:hypothetical protein